MENEGVQLNALHNRYAELLKIVESFEKLCKSEEWQTIQELVYGKDIASIDRQLMYEVKVSPLDTEKIYKLQGKREWALRHAEPFAFIEGLKRELTEIKKKVNE